MRIDPQGVSSYKRFEHILVLEEHAIFKLHCVQFHVVTKRSQYTPSSVVNMRQAVAYRRVKTMEIQKPSSKIKSGCVANEKWWFLKKF